jgi:hypothetical protein
MNSTAGGTANNTEIDRKRIGPLFAGSPFAYFAYFAVWTAGRGFIASFQPSSGLDGRTDAAPGVGRSERRANSSA